MRRYNPFYFIAEALKSLKRNGVMTFASIAVLMSCLVVVGGFFLLVYNIDVNLENFGVMNKIEVFSEFDASPAELEKLEKDIRALDNVADVIHTTKEQRLAAIKETYQAYEDITDEENPLSDSFEVTYSDNSKVPDLVHQLNSLEGVRKINNRYDLAKKIDNFKHTVMMIFIWFLAILFVVSLFIIVNTIKLALSSRKKEIEIMRYVGASKWFITLPFIIEGILIGAVSGVLSFFIVKAVYSVVTKQMADVLQMLIVVDFKTIGTPLVFAFLGIGILTGIIGSFISITKHLNT
ncbi:MAG: permease-like cell division protein FtsX [Clostridia bacterium]|nr:permease-like cell division protein FtsX [Clostridia bacterium]